MGSLLNHGKLSNLFSFCRYAGIQQIPWIVLGGMVIHTNIEFLIDQVRTVPTIPSLKSQATIPMNFFERLSNTKDYLYTMALFWYVDILDVLM